MTDHTQRNTEDVCFVRLPLNGSRLEVHLVVGEVQAASHRAQEWIQVRNVIPWDEIYKCTCLMCDVWDEDKS